MGNAKFRGPTMLRNRTRDDHFGSLFAYHSDAYRYGEREIRGPKMLRNRTRGDHFGSLFGYHSGADRYGERETSASKTMLRNRTRGDHFDSLFGCHSGAYRYGERELPGSKYAPLCSAIARGTTISARFSDTILARIATGSAKFRRPEMLRNRTRGDHFGSLFGYHSGAYRYREREISGSKTFSAIARGATISAHVSDTILERARISAIEQCCAIPRGGPVRAASRTFF